MKNDFYTGYEGEPEIIFFFRDIDGQNVFLKTWIGFFDSIMGAIEPNEEVWRGLSYYYHTVTGCFEEIPWKIPDLSEALIDLQSVNKLALEDKALLVYQGIIELLEKAHSINEEVWVQYD